MSDERKFVIYEGHAVSNKLVRREWTWNEFKRRSLQSKDTGETRDEYLKINATDKPQALRIKDVGGFVAGEFSKPIRQKKYLVSRSMITLDLERNEKKASKKPDVTAIIGRLAGKAYVVFSTHKYTVDDPRIRIVLPLLYDIPAENYSFVAESVARFLGVYDCLDAKASIKTPHQIMFWPSNPHDVKPFLKCGDGQLWDPADYMDESIRSVRSAKKQADPSRKSGPMGIFARAYKGKWEELVSRYDLPYEEDRPGRWRYTESSSVAGVLVFSDGLFINSCHATDPARGLHNYYDAVRLHKFADQDKTPPDGDLSRCGEKATLKAIMSDPVYKAQTEKEGQQQSELPSGVHDVNLTGSGGSDKRAMKDLLYDIAMSFKPTFYRTASNFYMDIAWHGKPLTLMIGSPEFKHFFRRRFWDKHGKMPNAPAVKEAAEQLESVAAESQKIDVYLRVAQIGTSVIYYDLNNEAGQVVQITAQGWQVLDHSPVKFIHPEAMGALPVPECGGSIDELREVVNTATEDDFRLYVGCLIAAMRCDASGFFIMSINGEHGSGKSTLSKIAHRLIDPSEAELMSVPDDEKEFGLQAAGNWFPTYDNLKRVSSKMSDWFCRLATGASFQSRALYENTRLITVKYKRPALINGITDLGSEPDFLNRLIRIHTAPLGADRQSDIYGSGGGIMTKFEAMRPRILGVLFDALSSALRNVNQVKLKHDIRLRDAAMFVSAAELALGWSGHDFENAVSFNQSGSQSEAADQNPFIRRLVEFMTDRPEYKGTAEQILKELTNELPYSEQKYFPKQLKKQLQQYKSTLRKYYGVTWRSKHTNQGSVYLIKNERYNRAGSVKVSPFPTIQSERRVSAQQYY
jgi:energy-coupling factor transporter ATP-binding protein EcfA2